MPDETITLSKEEADKLEIERGKREYSQQQLADQVRERLGTFSVDTYKRIIGRRGVTDIGERIFHSTSPNIIRSICGVLGIEPTAFIDADKWQGSRMRQYTQGFDPVIEDKTNRFIGREFVFKGFQEFREQNPSGYFILEGYPGSGKSSVSAYYVKEKIRKDCVYYFNNYYRGQNSPHTFIKNICGQLIERYRGRINLPVLNDRDTQDGVALFNLLMTISEYLKRPENNQEKLVIVVDALDEVNLDLQPEGTNILYLPDHVPDNVYFFLTRRSELNLSQIIHNSPECIMNFNQFNNESKNDIKRYIEQFFNEEEYRYGLYQFIDNSKTTRTEFIEQLTEKSEYNFMYLRYVIPEIANGYYQTLNITELPTGLQSYYGHHWRLMGMQRTPLPETKIKLIYLICEYNRTHKDFISIKSLAEYAQVEEFEVQKVINEWSKFLDYKMVDNTKLYYFYHKSFQDFLFKQDIIRAANIKRTKLNEEMAENLMNAGYGDV